MTADESPEMRVKVNKHHFDGIFSRIDVSDEERILEEIMNR
jgi:hypothetical protein